MIKTLIIAAVLTCGAATANAQCPQCTPQQPGAPTAQDAHQMPKYVWVRRGIFRCRWVLTRVYPSDQVQVIGFAQR